METAPFNAANGSNAARRVVGRLAVIVSLTFACVFVMQSNAFASGGLSSIILSIPEPGLVAVPLGTYNGPITQSNVNAVMGSSTDATSSLGHSLADGSVTGYIRSWAHQPSDGDAVVIGAFQFTFAAEEVSFLDSLDTQMHSQSGSAPLTVPGIPGVSGAEVHTSASGTPLAEYEVTFEKGNTVFQVAVASSSGSLTSADAISIADRQFANAPDTPASTASVVYRLDWTKVGILAGGVLLTIVLFIVGRKRKYPMALSGVPFPRDHSAGPSTVGSSEPPRVNWPPAEPISTEQQPKVGTDQWR
jgi:hypothetical protein